MPMRSSSDLLHFKGRIVATPLPDRWTTLSSDGKTRFLAKNRAEIRKIDASILQPKPLSSHHDAISRPQGEKKSQRQQHLLETTETAFSFDEQDCSVVQMDVYIEPEPYSSESLAPFHLSLIRDVNEDVANTLNRVTLNVVKKIKQLKRKRIESNNPTKLDVPKPYIFDLTNGRDLLHRVEFANVANGFLWKQAFRKPMALQLNLPSDTDNQDQDNCVTQEWLLSVESYPPTLINVHTFEDFSASMYPGVPIVIKVDTLYATHCRIDWYVAGMVRQQTTTTGGNDDFHIFIPENIDIGKEVAVLVTPYRTAIDSDEFGIHDGRGSEQAYLLEKTISPFPGNHILNLRRNWLVDNRNQPVNKDRVRVLSYNILANQNAFEDGKPLYPYVSKDVLAKERRFPLILQEILAYDADIICLQEVDEIVFQTLLYPALSSSRLNYQGYFAKKEIEGSREGCAMFWSLRKFRRSYDLEMKTFSIKDILLSLQRGENKNTDWKDSVMTVQSLFENHAELSKLFTKHLGHVCQMVPLKLCSSEVNVPIWIVNTHLFFHPLASHIRLLQMFLVAKQLDSQLRDQPGNVILCGDFNSSLQNAAGKLLTEKFVPANFRDNKMHFNTFQWEMDLNGRDENAPEYDFPGLQLPPSFPDLASAIHPTPDFTHYIVGFQGTLDHILISKGLKYIRSAPMPNIDDVTANTAMPCENIPSDHVSLVCDVDIIASK
jgi:mRNA deadenylase 3'-5' endonuclease subunit Ccr4